MKNLSREICRGKPNLFKIGQKYLCCLSLPATFKSDIVSHCEDSRGGMNITRTPCTDIHGLSC